jgi:hypothetical protein
MTTDDVSVLKSSPMQPSPGANPATALPGFLELREPIRESDLLLGYSKSICVLREAAAEALLSGALVLADVQRDPNWKENITKESEQRFRKALEALAGALG